jgi:hypothetical protein
MADPIIGKVEFQTSDGKVILTIDPDSSFVIFTYQTPNGPKLMELTNTARLSLYRMGPDVTAFIDGMLGWFEVGGGGVDGRLAIRDKAKTEIFVLSAANGDIDVGGGGKDATLRLYDGKAAGIVLLDAANGDIDVGGGGKDGTLRLYDGKAANIVLLDAANGQIALGGGGKRGTLRLQRPDGQDRIQLGFDDSITIKTENGNDGIVLSAFGNSLILGTQGSGGGIFVKDDAGAERITLDGRFGDIRLSRAGEATIVLDGNAGDIRLSQADCAEEFDVRTVQHTEPGTVMVIGEDGTLERSSQAYDRRVAGVISGAGDCKPAIILDRKPSQGQRISVALVGKVHCNVDAQYAPIRIGDLLTTSDTPGHAMKAQDATRAFGAVIGKALHPLEIGHGAIPILVALQ